MLNAPQLETGKAWQQADRDKGRTRGRSIRGGTESHATPAGWSDARLQLMRLVMLTITDTAARLRVHVVHHAANAAEDGSRLQRGIMTWQAGSCNVDNPPTC